MGESRDILLADLLLEARAYGSKTTLAKVLGVSVQTVHNKLKKPSTFSDPELVIAAEAMGLDMSQHLDYVNSTLRLPKTSETAPKRFSEPPVPMAGFVLVPRYDVEASAGNGSFNNIEQVIDYMAFREDWARRTLRVDPKKLVLITAIGDSMEPAIRAGDLLLIDTGVERVIDDAIYILVKGDGLVIKRVQQFFNGTVAVKSDNTAYIEETFNADEATDIKVAGRVRWIGRLI